MSDSKPSNPQWTLVKFIVLLTITFIVCKLRNVITWSWWWVTSPLWIPAACILLAIIPNFLLLIVYRKEIFTLKRKPRKKDS